MADEGVMGYMAQTSLKAWATVAAAVFPSIITILFSDIPSLLDARFDQGASAALPA